MDFIKAELDKEFETIGYRNQRRLLRPLKQVGKSIKAKDEKRDALMAGKRISKNGKPYWETRKNRSDGKDSKV
jgi:hypothetical protein